MAFETFSDFLNMGGHGLYVWLSYGLGLLTIALCLYLPIIQGREMRRSLRRRIQRESVKS
jgi:heme exporter protein D